MSRRPGVIALLLAPAGAFPLVFGPLAPGEVRLGGMSLVWWYAAVVAPLVAAGVTAWVLRADGAASALGRLAIWTSPVLFGGVAARVFAGDAGAPLLVLVAVVAPLVALLAEPGAASPGRLGGLAWVLALGLVLWANLALLAGAAGALGIEQRPAVAIAALIVMLPTLAARIARRPSLLMGAALAALAVTLTVLAAAPGLSPWAAWADVATRPALVFDATSPWITDGRRLAAATTLTFTQPHRVTAASPGLYRVLERDGAGAGAPPGSPAGTRDASGVRAIDAVARPVAREWRLGAGESLSLRPGDQLELEVGTHVRFEPGKRVPGAAISGMLWADPPGRRSGASMLDGLGVAVTLLVGALAIVGRPLPSGRRVLGPAAAVGFTVAAAIWGVYAVHGGPALGLGVPTSRLLLEAPAALAPWPWGGVVVAMTAGALVLLALAAAAGLRERLEDVLAKERSYASALWVGLVAAAAVLAALWPVDPWRLLVTGLGLAGSVVVAPALAGGARPSRLAGALVGATAFAALALAAPPGPEWVAPLATAPALVAAPLAWVTTAVAARVAAMRAG